MAPESGSGPNGGNPPRPPAPPGWDRRGGLDVYELNIDHPKYPPEWREPARRAARARLDADEHVQAAITDLREAWQERIDVLEGLAFEGVAASRWLDFTGDSAPIRAAQEMMARLDLAILVAALDANPGDVPIELLVAYIAEQTLPDNLHRWWSEPASPVTVIANGDASDPGQVVPIPLYPGEVVIKISGGTAIRDVGKLLSRIIDEAQGLAGQRKAKGGRRRTENDPKKARTAREVVMLRRRGIPDPKIANGLGLLRPGERGTERRVVVLLNRLGKVGERLLAEEEGRAHENPSTG